MIHQGLNTVTQEGGFTEGCIAITSFEVNMDKETGQTDVDRNYAAFTNFIMNGGNIDVIVK